MEDISPGNSLYFSYMPSLLHIASVKIASRLLIHPDIGEILDKVSPIRSVGGESKRLDLWKSIENMAEEKLPPLPSDLGTTVAKFILPMYYQVVHWLLEHDLYYHEDIYLFIKGDFICWKSDGTIDREKTAKEIIQDQRFELNYCFKIACTYNFTHEIHILWNRIKKARKKKYLKKGINPAVRFWMKYLKKGRVKTKDELTGKYFNPLNFESRDVHFIHLRLSCYFPFLPKEFNQEYLVGDYRHLTHSDDVILCLKQMNEAERMEFFHSNRAEVLIKCIRWPFYSLWEKALRELSSYLTLDDFDYILEYLLRQEVKEGFDCYELFKEFWNIIPESYKDEIKKDKNKFNIIQEILSHNKISDLKSLVQSIEKCYPPRGLAT